LRREKDELNDLIRRFEEYIADCNDVMEAWRDTFDIKETDKGVWTWELGSALGSPRNALARRFNRRVRLVHERDVGRPLAASEEDVAVVTKMHKEGKSLRRIAEEMELGLDTVRTIVGRINWSDDALPKRMQSVIETGNELVKEAKGLERGRTPVVTLSASTRTASLKRCGALASAPVTRFPSASPRR
jgi:hypothetical protein